MPDTAPSRNSAGTTAKSPSVGLNIGCASAKASAWTMTAAVGDMRRRKARSSRPRNNSSSQTGATANKKGLFEVADKGTIFLDEVGDTSVAMQVKLLRVLQERTLRRVGGTEEIPIDVRIIAATNRNLSEMVAENQFREDLFYRISVIPLELPPLRHRRDDIPLLADHFLARLNSTMGKKIDRFSDDALKKIESYDWPGNVRELENAMERAFILETSNELSAQHLPESVSTNPRMRAVTNFPDEGFDLESYVEALQKGFLEEAPDRQPPEAPDPLRPVLAVIDGLVFDPSRIEGEDPALKVFHKEFLDDRR